MSVGQIKPGASHPRTNEIIFALITGHISGESAVLDFGAGQGYMSQRIGQYFKDHGKSPRDHIHACEIACENFRYRDIDCEEISINSEIPFGDKQFDLIYAIEVLEHTPRPYDFFAEAFKRLKEGGTLIFSTPNIAHFKSRIAFLLSGYPEMYGPLSIENKNAGRVCGHIMPLSYNNFHYGLRKAGFADIEFHVDRLKKGALLSAIPVYPLLAYSRYRTGKRLMRYDQQVFSENESAIPVMNSLKMLASRSCILVARKPKTLTTRPG